MAFFGRFKKDHEKPTRHGKVQYEHCPGYTDKFGIWNNGFNCPRWGGPNDVYCCGNERERFCCLPSQQQQPQQPPSYNHVDEAPTTPASVGYEVLIGSPDQPAPTVMVPVLMIATGAGIVLAMIVIVATVCLCCLFCRCCRGQKSKLFKPNQKVDLMNVEAAKIASAIEAQAMTSASRPRTPSSVHMTSSKVVDISNIKESRFSFSAEDEENTSIMDAPGTPQIGKWNGPGENARKSTRELEFINLPPIMDGHEEANYYNDNYRYHDSIMTTSDYHSSSPLTGHSAAHNSIPGGGSGSSNVGCGNGAGGNNGSSNSATLGRHQQQKQRCHFHQHQASISSSSGIPPSNQLSTHQGCPPSSFSQHQLLLQRHQQQQQQQLLEGQPPEVIQKLTYELLHSLSPALNRHHAELGSQLSPYLTSKYPVDN